MLRAAVCGGCFGLLVAASAEAAPPCGSVRPWVAVKPATGLPADLEGDAVVERLRAELRARRIDLCEEQAGAVGKPAVATIALAASGGASPEQISIEIEVRDDVTSKRVARAVDLASVPADGRAAVVALAADELLRASWAELALEDAKVAKRPAPPEVRAAVAPAAPPPAAPPETKSPPPVTLGVRGAGEYWSAGLLLLGGDGELSWLATDRFSLELHAGARVAPPETSDSGEVSVLAASLRAGGRVALNDPRGIIVVSLAGRASGYWLRMSGDPNPGTRGEAVSEPAFAIELAPRLDGRIARGLHVAFDVGAGAALRGVEARDQGTEVTGLAGVGVLSSLGLIVGGP